MGEVYVVSVQRGKGRNGNPRDGQGGENKLTIEDVMNYIRHREEAKLPKGYNRMYALTKRDGKVRARNRSERLTNETDGKHEENNLKGVPVEPSPPRMTLERTQEGGQDHG